MSSVGEKEQRERSFRRVFLPLGGGLLAVGTLVLAAAIRDLSPAPDGGDFAVAAARSYYAMGIVAGLALAAAAGCHRRNISPDPFGIGAFLGWAAAAGTVWAMMHAAALLAVLIAA